MTGHRLPPVLILSLLFVAIFLAFTTSFMLAPLLVELAAEFHTSVAIAGQLAAATSITWAITAPVVGPLSDTHGRRFIVLTGLMLMAIGVLGSVLAWSYASLLGFRLLTGIGMATIAPSCLAAAADIFPAEQRGKAIGWLISATGAGAAFGIPAVAILADAGGWKLPFYVIGGSLVVLAGLLWLWLPSSYNEKKQKVDFLARFKELGSSTLFWYILVANLLVVTAFSGILTYLAVYLIETYSMHAGETALPLALAGLGVIVGSFIGGRVAGLARRLRVVACSILLGGLVVPFVFVTAASPWVTVALSAGVAAFLVMSWPVTSVLLLELASRSRATALGMFAFSNQAGSVAGASLGGLMLALGGFPLVGFFCLGAAVIAAALVLLKLRDSKEFIQGVAIEDEINTG